MKRITKTDWVEECGVGHKITLLTGCELTTLRNCRLRLKFVGEKFAVEIWAQNGAVTRLNHLFDSQNSATSTLDAIEERGAVNLSHWTQQPKEDCYDEWIWCNFN